jgi:hypothetical protein
MFSATNTCCATGKKIRISMNQHDRMSLYPIGSMYGIYANIWGILMVNVTIYSSTMDPMGICLYQYVATKTDDFTPLKRMNATRISTIAVGFQAPISGARKHAWPSRRLRRQLVGIFCRFVRKKKRFFWERTKSHG